EATLGQRRAGALIKALVAQERVTLSTELAAGQSQPRRQHNVRLIGSAAALDAWRVEARARLDTLPPVPKRRPRWQTPEPQERQAERILRQLAAVDLLARQSADAPDVPPGWRVEELRRLTRATQGMLDELASVGLIAFEEVEVRRDPLAGRSFPPS